MLKGENIMAEIIYKYNGKSKEQINADIRGLTANDMEVFNEHLKLCSQRTLEQTEWIAIQNEATYCLLFENGVPAARACVERYSDDAWEVGDVRVVREYRNRGLAYEVCAFVLQYVLENKKTPTMRTEEDNRPMRRVIEKLNFTPMV